MKRFIFYISFFSLLLLIFNRPCYGFVPTVSFEGEMGSTTNEDFLLKLDFPQQGSISLTANSLGEDNFLVQAKVDHFKFLGLDLFMDFSSEAEFVNKDDNKTILLHGQAHLENSVINHKPSQDLEFYYEIAIDKESDKATLWIPFLRWGDVISYGKAELFEEGQIEWNIFISAAGLDEILDIFGKYIMADYSATGDSNSEGQVWGKIVVGGLSSSPIINGRVEILFGVNPDGYQKGIFNFKGKYPLLKFYDSYFTYYENTQTRLAMDGYIDLNYLEDLDSKRHGLVFYPTSANYGSESTIISTDMANSSQILISREFLEGDRLDFKSYFDESSSAREEQNVVEMNADLKNKKFLKMYLKEGEDIIGFGKSIKF